MPIKPFQAESKHLLDLMIHSIYTHKEIFLRELISNASDAIDKLYYKTLSEENTGLNRDDFAIRIVPDKENRKLTISDNGCGMTREELETNLGTIAKSGSLDFKNEFEKKPDIEIIGQFGVGFYSAFMVSDHVAAVSRAFGGDETFRWESHGAEGYTVEPCEKRETCGTDIIIDLKPDTEDEKYGEYLDAYTLRSLIKKYSDYIRYPIRMNVEKSRLKEGSKDEYESYTEEETLNSMVPLWRKNKNEITKEQYHQFYKDKFMDYEDPARVIHMYTEGVATFHALMYLPARAPYDFYTKEYEKGLQLYSNGVLIMDKCADLLPDYFSFVRGLVDSQDLSLNISREMLQHDRRLTVIAGRVEKKIQSELESMLKNEREDYEKFFRNFGLQLKYGVYQDFGAHKDALKDLLLFHTSAGEKYSTLAEYVARMKEDQKYIYYACGETVQKVELLPQTEAVKDHGYEILYLTDPIDEFAVRVLEKYQDKEFKSVSADDLDLETEEEKQEAAKKVEENKDMLAFLKDALNGKVKAVVLSNKLKTHPVCLTTSGAISMEMEKVLNSLPNAEQDKVKAQRVLEINANHPVFEKLTKLYDSDREKLKTYASLLYTQALLIEGAPIDDPVAFSNQICSLMTE
ncbi:Chaperone protein HtpG [Caprobacter fermentans]|uniref:Chaperone protein HtpG n=1 Tax=Caproicibacter fermentans TaxID=2576756 RepID=A0A6N8HZ20_9FIRM|nr:molecular chaperone HtpG [Caproicibacter fermentans]MVB10573.1 Chaperone protein HtpG [Caproicibacter fermentans]